MDDVCARCVDGEDAESQNQRKRHQVGFCPLQGQQVEGQENSQEDQEIHRNQGLDDAFGEPSFVEDIAPADTPPEQIHEVNEKASGISAKESQKGNQKQQDAGQQVGGLHTVLIEKDVHGGDGHPLQPFFQVGAGQIAVPGDLVHLFPVGDGHAVADVGGAVAAVHVSLLIDAERLQGFPAFFVFGPGVKIPHPLPVMIDLPKIGPFLGGVGGGVCSPQKRHSQTQQQGEPQKPCRAMPVSVFAGDEPFGQPEHACHRQHEVENILPHTVGEPGKKQGRYVFQEKPGIRLVDAGGDEAEQGCRRGKSGSGGVLGL